MTRNPVGDSETFSATYWSSILNAHAVESVISGCNPSKGSGDFDVDIAAGEVVVGGTQVSVSSGTVTLSTSDSNDRVDLVHVNSSGTLSKTEGTAATDPTAPDIPSDEVLLATVLVEGGASSLSSAGSKIADYRTIYVGGKAAKTVSSNITTADEEIIGVDTQSARTITLATADAYLGKEIVIFDEHGNASSNNITIDTEGSEKIEPSDVASKTITVDYGHLRLIWDGDEWVALNRNIEANSITTDSGTIDGSKDIPGVPSSSSSGTTSFGSWQQISSSRPGFVIIDASTETDGTTRGRITLQVDESGGTTADYDVELSRADPSMDAGTVIYDTVSCIIPAGAQYQIVNSDDPNSANSIITNREFTL